MGKSNNRIVMAHLIKMALVDGMVSEEEESLLENHRGELGIPGAEYEQILADMKRGDSPKLPLDPEACRSLFLSLLEIAASDSLEPEETEYLRNLAADLGLPPSEAEELISSFLEFG